MTTNKNGIKELRKKLGLSQYAFALKCGIFPQMISQYELGKTEPSGKTLRKIADTFSVSIDTLI